MNLKQFFESQGYSTVEKDNFDSYIDLWNSWYIGKVKGFHSYWIYNRPRTQSKTSKKKFTDAKKGL